MSDAAPELGSISQHSDFQEPTSSSNVDSTSAATPTSNGNTSLQNIKDAALSNAQAAINTVANHPVTQNVKDTVANGPIADNIKDQHAKTTSEFRNLADSRTTPSTSTTNGQPLTHYHSFFYNLLSWENPRATAISFAAIVAFIFAARYLPALRWSFKALYIILGVTASAEIAGKLVLSQGLASSFRPRKYYTIPRESLEASIEDIEQLVNFFVIEFQRVLFAENVFHTIAAFASALVSYWLIKFVPLWGLSLIGVSTLYLAPLIYRTNKEFIDSQLTNASEIVNAQAAQVKDIAGHHTALATETIKGYAGDYTAKAQEMIGNARGRSTSPAISTKSSPRATVKSGSGAPPAYSSDDFPRAPKQDPVLGSEKSPFDGEAEAIAS